MLELKINHHGRVRNWRSFLARSLYNAANNFVRNRRVHEIRTQPLELEEEEGEPSLARVMAAPEEPLDLRLDLATIWQEMPPELEQLWELLLEEEGNTTAVAKRLNRPRKTVEYWVQKLRRLLKEVV